MDDERMERGILQGKGLEKLWEGEFRRLPREIQRDLGVGVRKRKRYRIKQPCDCGVEMPVSRGQAASFVAAIEKLIEAKEVPLAVTMAQLEQRGVTPEKVLASRQRKRRVVDHLKGEPVGEHADELVERDGELEVVIGEAGEAQEIDWSEEPSQEIKIIEEGQESALRPLPAHVLGMRPEYNKKLKVELNKVKRVKAEEIVAAMLQNESLDKVAAKFGLTRKTLDKLKRDPRFQLVYHERRQECLAMGMAYLQWHFASINKGLVDLFFDPEVNPAVRAHIGLKITERVQAQIDQEAADLRDRERLEAEKAKIEKVWDLKKEGE